MSVNHPDRVDVVELQTGKTISNLTDLEKRMRVLRAQGEVAFDMIAKELNQLPPGRTRTEEEFEQVCIALALFLDYLLSNTQG